MIILYHYGMYLSTKNHPNALEILSIPPIHYTNCLTKCSTILAISTINKKTFAHYERLLDSKEGRVIVGIDHGSCGGCHMKLQTQEIVNAKGGREMATCTNCGRLIYYTQEMVMADELD